jgi:hypothetical protein
MTSPRDDRSGPNESGSRDKYRDGDDVRDPIPADQRNEPDPDTKSEARGPARDNIGRTARGTAANPTGPEGNDRTKRRDD